MDLAQIWPLSNQGSAPIETVAPITAFIDCQDVDKQLISSCKCHLEGVLCLSLVGESNSRSLTNTENTNYLLPGQIIPAGKQLSNRKKLLLLGFGSLPWSEMGKAFSQCFGSDISVSLWHLIKGTQYLQPLGLSQLQSNK